MIFLLINPVKSIVEDDLWKVKKPVVSNKGNDTLLYGSRPAHHTMIGYHGNEIFYPKLVYGYQLDVQTKIILLAIMILLFVLVVSTTMKMCQNILDSKVKRNTVATDTKEILNDTEV